MSDKKARYLRLVYEQKRLTIQSKGLVSKLLLDSNEEGLVELDYNNLRETLPIKDYNFFKESLATLYKYKWLIKDDNNNTYVNLDKERA